MGDSGHGFKEIREAFFEALRPYLFGLGLFVVALLARLYWDEPEPSTGIRVLQLALEAVMVAAAVELFFQFFTFKTYFTNLIARSLKEALFLQDGFIKKIDVTEALSIRRRVTERILGKILPASDSLFELLMEKADKLLDMPYASEVRIHREYNLVNRGGRWMWRVDQTHTFRWVNDFADPIHHRASLGITFPKPPEGEEPIESYSFKVDGEEVKLKSETTTDDDEVCMEWNGAITIAPNRSVPVVKRSTRFIELDDRWTYQPVTPVCGLHVTCNFDQSVNPRLTFFGYETENCSEPIRKTRFASLDTKGWMLPRHVVLLEWSPPSIPESLFPDTEVTPETAIAPEAVDIDTRHRGE